MPIPAACLDCDSPGGLRIHGYKDRICHLHDRSLVRICEVRCKACRVTRRILPPFVVPRRRYAAPAIAAWLAGDPVAEIAQAVPETSTVRRWKKTFRRMTRLLASRNLRLWIRMATVGRKVHQVRPDPRRIDRYAGGGGWARPRENPTSGSSAG